MKIKVLLGEKPRDINFLAHAAAVLYPEFRLHPHDQLRWLRARVEEAVDLTFATYSTSLIDSLKHLVDRDRLRPEDVEFLVCKDKLQSDVWCGDQAGFFRCNSWLTPDYSLLSTPNENPGMYYWQLP
jgi:hypothetical protein